MPNYHDRLCKHCQVRRACRSRGLCWTCSLDPQIREMYPGTRSKYGHRGLGNWYGGRQLPDEPTTARPGSTRKKAVLHARACAGVALFHPQDRKLPD